MINDHLPMTNLNRQNKDRGSVKIFLLLLLLVILVQVVAGFDILKGLEQVWQLLIDAIINIGEQFYDLKEAWF